MFSFLSALLLMAAPAADAAQTADHGQPPAAKPEKPKKICRSVLLTGSRVPTRTCKTQQDWDRPAADGNAQLMLQDHGNGPAAAGGIPK